MLTRYSTPAFTASPAGLPSSVVQVSFTSLFTTSVMSRSPAISVTLNDVTVLGNAWPQESSGITTLTLSTIGL